MHLTVVDYNSHITGIASGKRSVLHTVHYAFQYGRHKPRIDSSAHHRVDKHKFASPFKFHFFTAFDVHFELLTIEFIHRRVGHSLCIRLHNQMYFTELSSSSGLLLMPIFSAGTLCNGFAIRYFRLLELNRNLLIVLQSPFQCT